MTGPAVSIVLPTYNRAQQLPAAIDSVLAQTFTDWELIVVDDGSTDRSVAVLAPYAERDARIKSIQNTRAHGPAGARNTGILAARGRLIAFIDSDDSWRPEKLAAFVDAAGDGRVVLVGSDYRMDDGKDGQRTMKSFVLGTMLPWWSSYPPALAVLPCDAIGRDFKTMATADLALSLEIAGFLWIHTSSAMVRRDAMLQAGLFDEQLLRTEDIVLWLKLATLGQFAFIDRVLATYDIRGRDEMVGQRYEQQDRSRRPTPYQEAYVHLRLLERIRRSYRLSPAQLNLLEYRVAAHHRMCFDQAVHMRSPRALLHLPGILASKDERGRFLRDVARRMGR